MMPSLRDASVRVWRYFTRALILERGFNPREVDHQEEI